MRQSETRGFRESLAQLKEGIISLVAMLNRHGRAELWFGIRDDGTATGVDVCGKTLCDVSQQVAAHVEPEVHPETAQVEVEGRQCLKVTCSGQERPYFAYGRAYVRVADRDRRLSAMELKDFIVNRCQALRWDGAVAGAGLEDLDEQKVRSFAARAGLSWDSMPNVLDKLGCLKDGRPVNAALLFFGRKPAARLRCAVFASTSAATILDQHDYEGDILLLIEEAWKYILKNIHIGMRLEGLYRVDVPEISVAALREAAVNAFCHRDYRDPDEVRVAVFKDRVEIRSPGSAFGGLTIAKLRRGGTSSRRNPLIADLLRRIHMAEGRGRGIPVIRKAEPSAAFSEIAQIFITSFARRSYVCRASAGADSTDAVRHGPVSMRDRILALIREDPSISLADMASRLGLTRDGVRYHTDRLQVQGFLAGRGGRNGTWEPASPARPSSAQAGGPNAGSSTAAGTEDRHGSRHSH